MTSDYVELRLRKANMDEMLKDHGSTSDLEIDTSSIVNLIETLSDLKKRLHQQRVKLAAYNAYKKQLRRFQSFDKELVESSRALFEETNGKRRADLNEKLKLDGKSERAFLLSIVKDIQALQEAVSKYDNVSVLAEGTAEKASYDELVAMEQQMATPAELKPVSNEFDQAIENIDYIAKNVPKLEQFLDGLHKNLEHDMHSKMLGDDYLPFIQHEFGSMANLVGPEVLSRARTIMMYHGENLRSIQESLEGENAWQEVRAAKSFMSKSMNSYLLSEGRSSDKFQLSKERQQACLREIIENGTPTLDEILLDIKLYFEGPINLNLMTAASAKVIYQKLRESDDARASLTDIVREQVQAYADIVMAA